MRKSEVEFRRENNVLIYTKLLNAPIELVWEVWTTPEHLKEWWGPDGFTLTHQSFDIKAGKEWRFIMHGMGQDFDNHIKYVQLQKPTLIKYTHSNATGSIRFNVTVRLERKATKTLMILESEFESDEIIAELVRQGNIIEGAKQHILKLDAYLAHLV
jgi:uncharacterized protein YndB with AHSA1/START domain